MIRDSFGCACVTTDGVSIQRFSKKVAAQVISGLQGMHERAHKVGGQLKFWSRPETGTEVELSVPGATAYQSLSDKSKKKFWLNRFQRLGVGIEKTDD
jgi:signal transduction histidine kinase